MRLEGCANSLELRASYSPLQTTVITRGFGYIAMIGTATGLR